MQDKRSSKRRAWFWLGIGLIGIGLLLVGGSVSLADIQRAFTKPPSSFGVAEAHQGLETQPMPSAEATHLPSTGLKATPTEAIETGEDTDGLATRVTMPEADGLVVEGTAEVASLPTATPTDIAPSVTPTVLTMTPEPTDTPVPPTPTPTLALTETPTEVQPPTRIVAPSIGLDTKVVPVSYTVEEGQKEDGVFYKIWQVADYAAGWNNDSKVPGQGGNIVIAGHNNIRGEVFRHVVDLEPGDKIILYCGDRAYTYIVESRLLLLEKGASDQERAASARWIGEFPDERLTLVTCWPYTGNTYRVIVIAKPAP